MGGRKEMENNQRRGREKREGERRKERGREEKDTSAFVCRRGFIVSLHEPSF